LVSAPPVASRGRGGRNPAISGCPGFEADVVEIGRGDVVPALVPPGPLARIPVQGPEPLAGALRGNPVFSQESIQIHLGDRATPTSTRISLDGDHSRFAATCSWVTLLVGQVKQDHQYVPVVRDRESRRQGQSNDCATSTWRPRLADSPNKHAGQDGLLDGLDGGAVGYLAQSGEPSVIFLGCLVVHLSPLGPSLAPPPRMASLSVLRASYLWKRGSEPYPAGQCWWFYV